MKINNIMKAIYFIFTLVFALLFINEAYGQKKSTDSIYWDNGNVSLLSDLKKVHILKKKGGSIKDANLYEIKKEKGVLVYEKDKCLHDLAISNIENIQPGYNPQAILVFLEDNTPYIKELSNRVDTYNEPTTFKVVVKRATPQKENKIAPPSARVIPAPIEETTPKVINEAIINTSGNDLLIDLEGNIWVIKIILLQEKVVEFKKISNPDGPIYVKTFSIAEITKNENSTTIKIIK